MGRVLVLAAAVLGVAPAAARADGAFPDSQTVLVPGDRPQEIMLVTNFGVVLSHDGGGSWQWSCERDVNAFGILYQRGPAPRRRLFAVANQALVYSDDDTCWWSVAGGSLTGRIVTDYFADPGDGNRVLAIAFADARYAVHASLDGAAAFGDAIYRAPGGDGIGGVEIARSDPATVYVSMTGAVDTHPRLARSDDRGAHWTENDLFADLGAGLLRIIAVDSQDPRVVLLRWIGADQQAVAITRDGGATATALLTIMGNLTGALRLADGTLMVSAVVDAGITPVLHRSRDGGARFEVVERPPAIRALAERAGTIYAATDNFGDGFALATSTDQGTTWSKLMSYDQVQAIVPCLRADAQCQATCAALAGMGDMSPGMIWSATVCSASPPPPPAPSGSGCSCAVAGEAGRGHDTGARGLAVASARASALALLAWALRYRRRATNTNIAASTSISPGARAGAGGGASSRWGRASNTRSWPRHRLR